MAPVLLLLLTSPFPHDRCSGLETLEWRLCQPRVVVIGPWDPVPYDYRPQESTYPTPPDYGAHKTEQRPDTCKYGIAE
jgi:hypothetical protein